MVDRHQVLEGRDAPGIDTKQMQVAVCLRVLENQLVRPERLDDAQGVLLFRNPTRGQVVRPGPCGESLFVAGRRSEKEGDAIMAPRNDQTLWPCLDSHDAV